MLGPEHFGICIDRFRVLDRFRTPFTMIKVVSVSHIKLIFQAPLQCIALTHRLLNLRKNNNKTTTKACKLHRSSSVVAESRFCINHTKIHALFIPCTSSSHIKLASPTSTIKLAARSLNTYGFDVFYFLSFSSYTRFFIIFLKKAKKKII